VALCGAVSSLALRSDSDAPVVVPIVVIGGGIGGLLAAAALAGAGRRVLVLDADELPDEPTPRAGIPQGRHSHILLARGRALFEELLPGIDAELAADAPDELDWGHDCLVFSAAGRCPRYRSSVVTRPSSRALLEWRVRRRVAALAGVTLRAGAAVDGLAWEGERVAGVRLAFGGEVAAALVVDASGRRSQAPEWLRARGFPAPGELSVDAGLGYATRTYRRPSGAREWKGMVISTVPPRVPRAAALWPIERDQWLVTLAGTAGNHPPTDEAGFLEFARGLSTPLLHDAIAGAEPTDRIRGHRDTANRWRRYDRLSRHPRGFVVLGDGICAFNPIYGQGMTVAALQARALAIALARGAPASLPRRYYAAARRAIAPAWLLATSEDRRWLGRDVAGGLAQSASRYYLDRYMRLTTRRADFVEGFLQVMHMTRPPSSLARPRLALAALWGRA
jgi:2-polyprenyl-6-methoxyphenol hydroxylase-like FAD-dependent oxidoreductase